MAALAAAPASADACRGNAHCVGPK
jgi:hypothetical protein